jgi:chorismate lyase / 3-hydroxybenzoate synthase
VWPVDIGGAPLYLEEQMAVDFPASERQVRVCFGRPETRLALDERGVAVHLAMPLLGGPEEEVVLEVPGARVESPLPGSALMTSDHWMAGAFVRPWHGPLDELSASLYRELLLHARGWNIGRIWNYVPDINSETTGLENYRRFNLGRWQAYHDTFGDALTAHLPAASAVGLRGDMLVTVFVATRAPVERIENPQQVPAWQYPAAYGPKAPSFVRATWAEVAGRRWSWVSGTASIRGHASVATGDVPGQLAVTLENLNVILAAMGLPALGAGEVAGAEVFTKVYLRHQADLRVVRDGLGAAANLAQFVEADVCRSELDLEIEVSARNFPDAAPSH